MRLKANTSTMRARAPVNSSHCCRHRRCGARHASPSSSCACNFISASEVATVRAAPCAPTPTRVVPVAHCGSSTMVQISAGTSHGGTDLRFLCFFIALVTPASNWAAWILASTDTLR